jgi:hypothetical protein
MNKIWLAAALAITVISSVLSISQSAIAQASGDTVLNAAEATKFLPASVFFRGQSATTQLRNSGGVKFADGMLVLSTLVDTSGYSRNLSFST